MDRQRIDKWLWHARVVRTRSAAAELAGSGFVRVNGTRIDVASRPVRPGDVVTIALNRRVRVMKVLQFIERRGGAEVASTLYEDLSVSSTGEPELGPTREPGSGRPTKRERRALDRLMDEDPI
jgi:ribosome-associated heat shock protein Hsp15